MKLVKKLEKERNNQKIISQNLAIVDLIVYLMRLFGPRVLVLSGACLPDLFFMIELR